MPEEVQELLVSIRSEGTKQVTEDLEKQRDTFEESSDSVGEETKRLEKFSRRWRGAATIFAGGFATLVAAVVSKMPVLQESVGLFGLVLDTAAMKMSRFTRDELSPMNDRLLETVKRINEADSALEVLAVTVAGLVTAPFQPGIALVEKFARKLAGLGENETLLHDRLIPAFEDLAETIGSSFAEARGVLSGFTDFVSNLGKDVINALKTDIVNPFIVQLNRLIRKANTIEGISISEISPLTTGPPSGASGRNKFRRTDPATGGGAALTPGGEVVVTGTLEQETNLDSRTVGESSKPFTVKGSLRAGRGARLR